MPIGANSASWRHYIHLQRTSRHGCLRRQTSNLKFEMNFSRLLLASLVFLFFSSSSHAKKLVHSMSWLASGPAIANYSIKSLDFKMTLEGSHNEIAFQKRKMLSRYQKKKAISPFTDFFTGWHLIGQAYSGQGIDSSGVTHAIEYSNQSIFFSLGFEWYIASFAHLQPYIAYGLGNSAYSAQDTAADGTVTSYGQQTTSSDMSLYGANLILEFTDKVWLGVATNRYIEKQPLEFDYGKALIEPQSSQTLMLVWNW